MARRRFPPRIESLAVEMLDEDGLGVARFGERECRIKNALPGETVEARVVTKRMGRLYGVAEAIDEGSTDRASPYCTSFPRCGGCSFQHWDYSEQLRFKHDRLLTALEEAGVSARAVLEPVSTGAKAYRRKARLGVRCLESAERVYVGFREAFGSYVADMNACPALVDGLSGLIGPLRSLVGALESPRRVPQIELAAGDRQAAIVLRHLEPLTDADHAVLRSFAARHGVWVYGQSGGYDTVERLYPKGEPDALLHYRNEEFDLELAFAPTTFIQVNGKTNERLTRDVVAALELVPGEEVLDLFCGLGNISLPIARRGARVLGLESSEAAIAMARGNAERNGLGDTAAFAVADLYAEATPVSQAIDKVVLDPPRTGGGPWLETLVSTAKQVVYVSCSAASFAADARRLAKLGFGLDRVGVYDMFPQTGHVEILGVFVRS